MSNFKAECRKFQPNIFNKIKCSNCFRQREEHTAEALESNRASRKVSKCGYLFVAPDWDFSNPLNRTKRWQRRWFVLFDDGELTYSVDDLPATIPQGVIDMNRVLEVSEAEDVTGNQFALAITSPDRATFVKGTCREESRWWRDVLSVFPRQHGRHKRNATFPGIKSSSVLQTRSALARTPSPAMAASFDPSTTQRVRFHSCTSDSFSVGRPSSAPTLGGQDDVFSLKDDSIVTSAPSPTLTPSPPPIYHSTPLTSLPPSTRLMRDEHKENTPPYLQDYHDHPPTSESPPTQDKVLGHRPRTRRTAKREARGLTHPRTEISHQLIISDMDMEDSKREEKLKDIADSITRPRATTNVAYKKKEKRVKPTREKDMQDSEQKVIQVISDDVPDSSQSDHVRGDPDGCGLEGEPLSFPISTDMQRVDLPAEDVLYIKKGWLMKQGFSQQEWSKHWFVLQGNGLRFYRDPSAEDNGILDGIIDLGMVKNVEETEVGRNYGFRITTWDDKKYIFSAVTSGIRTNWVQALRNAANLKEPQNRPLTLGEKLEREIVATKDKSNSTIENIEAERDATTTSITSLGRSFVSSDDDFKTASETSFFKDASREDLTNYDRLRSRSNSRVLTPSKRSRSSPPSSRRGTRDDFPSSKLSDSVSCFSETDSIPSIQDLDKHETPEKDSNGTTGSTGESMLVDLLETQVESLKAKLEQTQINDLQKLVEDQEKELYEKNNIISKLENLRQQFQEERKDWKDKVNAEEDKVKELSAVQHQHSDVVRRLTRSLQEAELKIHTLNQELRVSASGIRSSSGTKADEYARIRSENIELNKQIAQLMMEIARLKDNLKSEKSEVYKWKDLVKELRSLLDGRNEDMESKREEVMNLREKLKTTQSELDSTADRLFRGIEENECLCNRVRELERNSSLGKVRRGSSNLSISSSRERFSSKRNLPRMDSLSDLTNFNMNLEPEQLEKDRLVDEYSDLRIRFEKAVNEIKAIKREVREAQTHQDDLELVNQMLQNEIKAKEEDYLSQIRLMSTRIQDLTNKLTNSEKQVRSLKQKMSRAESRERRRTLSLKGKESFALSKDMESKLSQLESKVDSILNGDVSGSVELRGSCRPKEAKRSQSFEESTKASRLRRKSLDGSNNEDAMKAIVRMNDLETKVAALSGKEFKKLAYPNLGNSSNSSSSNLNQSPTGTINNSSVHCIQIPRSRSPPNPSSPVRSPLWSPSSPRKAVRSPRLTPEKFTKITRSDSEPRIWKEKLTALEKVFNILQTKHLEEDHRNSMEALQSQHQAEIDRLRDQVKYDPPTRDSDDELTELKRRLCLLEEGYEAQISALKKQYQEALGSRSDVCEENIRQRYQLEIEHLRDLCEKGLNAMESSHRRHITDLEEKHRREMATLQAEKEEALAEETQATLAALDAMRKAHEAEVLKEVSKFKEEFLRRTENGLEGAAHSRLHEGEMRDVRREILALSEKYSEKCLEMAAKEQKLEGLQRQLSETKTHSRGLEERNRHLKQKLISHISHIKTKPEKSSLELQHQHECELALKDEEISRLNQMLQKSKMHESDLGNLCGQLGQFLKTEKSLRTSETAAIRDRLENHVLTAVKLQGEHGGLRTRWSSTEEQDRLHLETAFNKEVTRSPSCPGLSGFSPFSYGGTDYKDSPVLGNIVSSPLMGMVALRKKIFEGPPTSKTKC